MSKIKYMSISDFIEQGYLQEANRQFFHPLGLALVVACGENDPTNWWIHGVWDNREDPEGIAFEESAICREKAERIVEQQEVRGGLRSEALGYVVQEVPSTQEG